MAFQPRMHENGGICCSAELALCDKCKAHFAWGGAPRGLRTAAEPDYTPPDPYEPQLARLRADVPSNRWPEPPVVPSTPPGDYTPPDPYRAQLDKMRRENR